MKTLLKSCLVFLTLFVACPVFAEETVYPHGIYFSAGQEWGEAKGTFKLEALSCVIEIIGRPYSEFNCLETDMAWPIFDNKPRFGEPLKAGIAITKDRNEEVDLPEDRTQKSPNNGKGFAYIRWQAANFTLKGYWPLSLVSNGVRWYPRVRLEDCRYCFDQKHMWSVIGDFEYAKNIGFNYHLGLQKQFGDFTANIYSNGDFMLTFGEITSF